jgi:FkbM family methyltransferase
MTSFGSLMRRRRREVTLGELLRDFHFRDLLYLWGHRAADLEIVPGLRSRFGPSEKFLFFSLKNSILLLRKRGFGVTFSEGRIVVTDFPYLEQPLRLPVPAYGPRELRNLFTLLRHGLTHGAAVGTVGARVPPRFWALDVEQHIVTVNGTVRFYLDLIDPWTLTETYTLGIHQFARFEGTTVLDVGAEFGDSSLFFAAQGARVIAVEPVATNFDALQRNIALNEAIGHRVGPVHAAIGPTGRQKMYGDPSLIQGNASAFPAPGADLSHLTAEEVDSFSVSDLLDHLGVDFVDHMKMDGKGCEYLLSSKDLARVRGAVAIEYSPGPPDRLAELVSKIRSAGFVVEVALHNPESSGPLVEHGTIYGRRSVVP